MSSVLKRTGRQRQRYEDNMRLVSGCIPYRWRKDNTDQMGEAEEILEVLMVSSPKRDDLVFPKGGWEDDETVLEAACREALEEAGVKGILRIRGFGNLFENHCEVRITVDRSNFSYRLLLPTMILASPRFSNEFPKEIPLGKWEFRSKSSQDDLCGMEGGCRGYMFALEVTEELETWPEQKNRARQWLCVKEAFRLSRYDWMCNALEEFMRVMEEVEEETKLETQDKNVEAEDVSECQSKSPKCYKRSSTMQHHGMLQHASQEIAIHFGY